MQCYWNFNEGTGTSLTDQSSNSNSGTINGATWTQNVPILGCTNQYADNYNSNANVNVGCEFEQNSNSILYTVNPQGNTLNDYELLFDVPAQDEMSSDYSDVLFVDSFNNVLSSYVSEYDENSAKIWVKLDTLFLVLLILFCVFMESLPFQTPMILSKFLLFMKILIMEAFTTLGQLINKTEPHIVLRITLLK